jgi:hypothetical protein
MREQLFQKNMERKKIPEQRTGNRSNRKFMDEPAAETYIWKVKDLSSDRRTEIPESTPQRYLPLL